MGATVKHRSFIALAVSLVVLLGTAVGVYAYDAAREDRIAEGITAGGVDLGGLSAAQARAALERELAAPLRRPVTVRHGARRFRLSAEQARVRIDVGGMVADALRRSRRGNVLSRTARDIGGGRQEASLRPSVTYSETAVRSLVAQVKRASERPAQDARLRYGATGIDTVAGQSGRTLRAARLRRAIARELTLAGGAREIRPAFATVRPKVSRRELAGRFPAVITVDRGGFRLRLFRNLRLVRTYRIALGRAGQETPGGLYRVQNKAVDPAWNVPKKKWAGALAGKVIPGGRADNPLKARWLGFFDGAGIHGTDDEASIGTNASAGCIRMRIPEVKQLYERVPVGTPLYIS